MDGRRLGCAAKDLVEDSHAGRNISRSSVRRGNAFASLDPHCGRLYKRAMLTRQLQPHTERAYAVLRIMSGLMFSFHGFQKILGIFTEHQPGFGSQIWIGGLIELLAGLAIALGALTSWAAFLASGTMAVAYTQFHWKLAFDRAFFPAINDGELALIYAFLFLYLACRGAGIWSVDGRGR